MAIDQHLLERKRPELLGIGLDENTGIIVKGDTLSVFGKSYVAIYDGTRWSAERGAIYTLKKGSREFFVLREGDRYDLKIRKVITNE